MTSFYQTYRSGLALTAFVALPASFLCFAIPDVLAHAISYGRMASPAGIELVTAAIGGMALGILGDSFFRVSTSASYARHDASAPLWALTLQAILVMAGMALAVTAQATAVVWALTLFTSAGNLAAAAVLHIRQMRPSGQRILLDVRRLVGNLTAALLTAGVAILAARWAGRDLDDSYASVFTALTVGTAGLSTYLCLQWFFGSVELRQLLSGVDRFIPCSTSCRPSLPRTAPRGSTGGSRRAH
jgi:peptidoglycan biosynthesis protein MviN/MurJ (putative lipid II flippase)